MMLATPAQKNRIGWLILAFGCWTSSAAGQSGGTKAQPAAPPKFSDAEMAERKKILQSPQWAAAEQAFEDWLSVQQAYDAKRIGQMRAALKAKISRMSASQLRQFLAGMDQKLAVLNSSEAQQARLWMAQYMALASQSKVDELRKQMPDISKLTAAQMQLELEKFDLQQASVQQTQAAFDAGRQQQVAQLQQAKAAMRASREKALDRAYSDAAAYGGGPYYNGNYFNGPGRYPIYSGAYRW
jgi:hypothetical protein